MLPVFSLAIWVMEWERLGLSLPGFQFVMLILGGIILFLMEWMIPLSFHEGVFAKRHLLRMSWG